MKNFFKKTKYLFSFLFLLIFFCSYFNSSFLAKAEMDDREENIMNSTVNLVCIKEAENLSTTGTGLIIDPAGYILTNKHVAAGSSSCHVYYPQGLNQTVLFSGNQLSFLVASSPDYDLSLLKIADYNRDYYVDIFLDKETSNDYQNAFYYGYPSRQPGDDEDTYLLTKGSGAIFDVLEHYVLVSIESSFGASGSGVFWENKEYLGTLYAISEDGLIIKTVPRSKVNDFIFSLISEGKMDSSIYTQAGESSEIDEVLSQELSGKILLQIESYGEAWYVYPGNNSRIFLGRPIDAFNIMRDKGLGISNENLRRIPISLDYLSGDDSSGDGLPDDFEIAIGTDPLVLDTDGDDYDDYAEIFHAYNPLGLGKLPLDEEFAKSLAGRILLQVERNGEAWYVNPDDNKRYFLGRPADAFNLMRNLGLGISNENLSKILIYN